jgi:hypothetical protein
MFNVEYEPNVEIDGHEVGDRYVVVIARPRPMFPAATMVHECRLGGDTTVAAKVPASPPSRSASPVVFLASQTENSVATLVRQGDRHPRACKVS